MNYIEENNLRLANDLKEIKSRLYKLLGGNFPSEVVEDYIVEAYKKVDSALKHLGLVKDEVIGK